MFSLALKTVLVFMMSLSFAFASGGGGHGEAPAEGEKAEKKTEVKSSEDSYTEVQSRVSALEAKIRSAQDEIQKLLLEKHHLKDPVKLSENTKQTTALHKELKANLKEYDQQRSLLKYRYPEKGLTEKREYERIELKSLDEMENQMSLGSSVKRTLKKVRSQYGTPESEMAENTEKATVKAKKKADPGLTDAVILKK